MFAKQLLKGLRKVIIVVALFVFVLVFLTNVNGLSPQLKRFMKPLEIMSCSYTESEDVLPSADNIRFPAKSIFFHETSCKGGLDARQACAVESAARSHPDWEINVLFIAPATEKSLQNSSVLLETFKNIHFYRIHLQKYAQKTPLEKFVLGGALNRSRWPISHGSDVLRFLSLYKWGGVYLDLDVVVAKPFDFLAKNWAARESDETASAGALAFSQDAVGRRVARAAVRDIKNNFSGSQWGNNGPGVITRVLKSMCSTSKVSDMTASTCDGFEVYGPEYFYPVKWTQAKTFFEKGHIDIGKAYVYHLWNHHTHLLKMQRGCPYETLAKRFCPTVFSHSWTQLLN